MEVTLTQRIYGVEDGQVYPRWFEVGAIVKGDLAITAVDQGAAVAKKKRRPIEPENLKTSSVSQPDPAAQPKTAPKRRGRKPKSLS